MLSLKRNEGEHAKPHMNRISRTLHKWRVALKRATQETLNGMDDQIPGDNTIEYLFHGNPAALQKVASVGRDSAASMSPVGPSELNITTETEESITESSGLPSKNSNGQAGDEERDKEEEDDEAEEEEAEVSFKNFDIVAECAKLRKTVVGPFCGGNVIWEDRRALWVQPTGSQVDESEIRKHRTLFATIPRAYYTRIYKNLVLDDKPLRQPMNLKDAIQIINAGWVETKKWENAAKGLA